MRYVAMPQDAGRRAPSPSEKIYAFFLRDLADSVERNCTHGQAIACHSSDGLQSEGFCWEEKSIHEITRSGVTGRNR